MIHAVKISLNFYISSKIKLMGVFVNKELYPKLSPHDKSTWLFHE